MFDEAHAAASEVPQEESSPQRAKKARVAHASAPAEGAPGADVIQAMHGAPAAAPGAPAGVAEMAQAAGAAPTAKGEEAGIGAPAAATTLPLDAPAVAVEVEYVVEEAPIQEPETEEPETERADGDEKASEEPNPEEDLAEYVRRQNIDPDLTEGALIPPPPTRKEGGIGLVKIGRRLVHDAGRRLNKKGQPIKLTSQDANRLLKLISAAHDISKGAGCSGVLVLAPDQEISGKDTVSMLQQHNVPICGAENKNYPFVTNLNVGGCATALP